MGRNILHTSALVLCAQAQLSAAANNARNSGDGDQTVGGIHFFEIHAPGGGLGIGIKIMILLAILGVAVYCYYKWKNFRKKFSVLLPFSSRENHPLSLPNHSRQEFPMAVYTPCRHTRCAAMGRSDEDQELSLIHI